MSGLKIRSYGWSAAFWITFWLFISSPKGISYWWVSHYTSFSITNIIYWYKVWFWLQKLTLRILCHVQKLCFWLRTDRWTDGRTNAKRTSRFSLSISMTKPPNTDVFNWFLNISYCSVHLLNGRICFFFPGWWFDEVHDPTCLQVDGRKFRRGSYWIWICNKLA